MVTSPAPLTNSTRNARIGGQQLQALSLVRFTLSGVVNHDTSAAGVLKMSSSVYWTLYVGVPVTKAAQDTGANVPM